MTGRGTPALNSQVETEWRNAPGVTAGWMPSGSGASGPSPFSDRSFSRQSQARRFVNLVRFSLPRACRRAAVVAISSETRVLWMLP